MDIVEAMRKQGTTKDKILREVRIMKALKHRFVVQYYPARMTGRHLFIPMELCKVGGGVICTGMGSMEGPATLHYTRLGGL